MIHFFRSLFTDPETAYATDVMSKHPVLTGILFTSFLLGGIALVGTLFPGA